MYFWSENWRPNWHAAKTGILLHVSRITMQFGHFGPFSALRKLLPFPNILTVWDPDIRNDLQLNYTTKGLVNDASEFIYSHLHIVLAVHQTIASGPPATYCCIICSKAGVSWVPTHSLWPPSCLAVCVKIFSRVHWNVVAGKTSFKSWDRQCSQDIQPAAVVLVQWKTSSLTT